MRQVIRVVWIALLLAGVALLPPRVQAACQVVLCGQDQGGPQFCNQFGECEPNYCYNCAGSNDQGTCPPNQHMTPNGGCQPNGAGSCACGEFYACPTINKPEKQCACCPAQTSCFNAAVDCPAGTVRTNTVVGSGFCSRRTEPVIENICRVGNAQVQTGTCCNSRRTITDDCRITPSGREVCEYENICNGWTIRTYACVSTCNATPATGLTVVQGSGPAAATVTWTPGANGVSQRLRVDEDVAEVNAGCPTPNDCVVNESFQLRENIPTFKL